jgi:hypothetical protein
MPRRLFNRAPHVGGCARALGANLVGSDFERRPDGVESSREPSEGTVSAGADAIHDPTDASVEGAIIPSNAREHLVDCLPIQSVDDPEHRQRTFIGYRFRFLGPQA